LRGNVVRTSLVEREKQRERERERKRGEMIENHFTVTEITLTKVAKKQGQPEKIRGRLPVP
jgi:hypothetical protein